MSPSSLPWSLLSSWQSFVTSATRTGKDPRIKVKFWHFAGNANNKFFVADIKNDTSKSPLLKDDQIHADPDFYENLPFNKLRNPPKQVRYAFI